MAKSVEEKIKESLRWEGSRFQIDQTLLKAGHTPEEIEAAWKSLGITPPQERFRWAALANLKNILRIELICGAVFLIWHIANYFVTHSWPLIKQSNTMLQYGLAIHLIMSIGLIYFLCTRASYMNERRLRLSGAITAIIALTGIWLTVGGVFQSPTYVLVNKIEIANKHYMMVHIRDSVSHNFSVFECNISDTDCYKFDSREYRRSRWYVDYPDGTREYLDYSRFELYYDKDDDRLSIIETAENIRVETFDKAIARK